MLPAELTTSQFDKYPLPAREFARRHLAVLRSMPLSLLPSLLREVIEFDEKFPAERKRLERELDYLATLTSAQLSDLYAAFIPIHLSPAQERFDWINQPLEFSEQLSAYLWSTHQMDAFRAAATEYGERMNAAVPGATPPLRRLGIAVIGQGVSSYDAPLFRHLREHGTYFTHLLPADGLQQILEVVAERAKAHPLPYGHWYVDGGVPATHAPSLTSVSYAHLAPARDALLGAIQAEVAKPGMGPEQLRNDLARLSPTALGLHGDTLLDHFKVRVLTEGSGTQIFSTTFAQWTAREALRRAEALTLLVRYAPRQRQRPMNDLLAGGEGALEIDALGSLIDADMGSYYQWIQQRRLAKSEESSFLVWFEGQNLALAISPSLPRAVESKSPLDLHELLSLMTS